MKIAIIGADGQLGSDLAAAFRHTGPLLLTEREIDVREAEGVVRALAGGHPDAVINTAAMTDVDGCEGRDVEAFLVNALGAKNVARACMEIGASLVHISTDYVFDGAKGSPYVESDHPAPLNVYGLTKLAGEYYVRMILQEHYIVRTSGLYGTHPCIGKGRNFVDTMLDLGGRKKRIEVVEDEILTPTFTEDLAAQIRVILDKSLPYGTYHATNEGACSWFDFARAIFERVGISVDVVPTTSSQWGAPAKRPRYSVLENAELARLGCNTMAPWNDALERYLAKKL